MFSIIWKFFSSSLLFWEIAGYACTFVVILGCAGEYVAEFTTIPRGKENAHRLARLSLIVLTAGIAGELLTAIQSSRISAIVIADLERTTQSAEQSALSAQDAADNAAKDEKQLSTDLKTATDNEEAAQKQLQLEQQKTARAQKEAADAQLALNPYFHLES